MNDENHNKKAVKCGAIGSVEGVAEAGRNALREAYQIYKEKVEVLEGRDVSADELRTRHLVAKGTNGERELYWKGLLIVRMGCVRLKEDGTGIECSFEY